MPNKPNPCPLGTRHKWKWAKNVSISRASSTSRGASISATLKGRYLCECGETKLGEPSHDGGDLRHLIGMEKKDV